MYFCRWLDHVFKRDSVDGQNGVTLDTTLHILNSADRPYDKPYVRDIFNVSTHLVSPMLLALHQKSLKCL